LWLFLRFLDMFLVFLCFVLLASIASHSLSLHDALPISSTPLRKVEQVDEAISERRLTLADLNGNASGRRARKYPKQSQHRDTDEVSEKPRADGRHDPEQGGAWTGL